MDERTERTETANEGLPSGLKRLWGTDERAPRKPRLGLSLERIVQAAIGLADADGLGAVSMSRVAERLGFTTMSLYRYVTGKDELLLLMHDAAWEPPPVLDIPDDDWRTALEKWSRELRASMQRHPWLERIRVTERMGTPSQLTWLDRGLRALAGTPLGEFEKTQILLLLNGHVFADARVLADMQDAARESGVPVDEGAAAYGTAMRALADPERFPALRRAVDAGAFDPGEARRFADPDVLFTYGLERILDGVECAIRRHAGEAAES